MASLQCPNCGRDNPDFLDNCQFCQTVLRAESKLQMGQLPTKKNTGELEPILPDWLKDVRQQSRDSAEDGELPASSTQPRIQKNEAPDLLAGLASSQSDDDDDEIPDWLASINPVGKPKPATPSTPEPVNDFFAQFNAPAPEKKSEPPKEEASSQMGGFTASQPEQPAQKDELSEWFSNASKESNEPFSFDPEPLQDSDWSSRLGSFESSSQPAPEEKEDLGWLHNLEASAKQSETPSQPKQNEGWNFGASSTPASSQEDLSWLNNLGGTPASTTQPPQGEDLSWLNALGGTESAQPAPQQPTQPEDLSWLDTLGGTSAPAQATPSQPSPSQPSQQEDLSWLNALGGNSEPAQPTSSQPSSSEDLSWLNDLGGTPATPPPAPSQPSQQEDLSWLNALGGTPEPSQPSSGEDLSWLDNLGGTPLPSQPNISQPSQNEDLSWLNNPGGTAEPVQPTSGTSSSEDLSWLDSLGGAAVPSQPEATSAPASSQDDLSWLNQFGATSEPAQETSSAQEDLGWLNNLGGEPAQPATTPSAAESNLDWLDQLGGTSAPAQPETTGSSQDELDWLKNFAASTAEPSEPSTPASIEPIELGWLDNLGSAKEPVQPAAAQPQTPREEPDWLSGLDKSSLPGYISSKPFGTTEELNPPTQNEAERVSPFVPRKTAPLGDAFNDDMPDWLRSATEEKPDLPLGASALEQFRDIPRKPADEKSLPSTPEPEPAGADIFSSSGGSFSNKDVDSLFSVDMPDWLSKPQSEGVDVPSQKTEASMLDDSLSPVELPSWVQAMRPVESVISETGPSIESQPTEKEGPLAGLRGVIPSAPIGSSRRPKAISLKLQASDEQQAGASLFDQILAGETTPKPLTSDSTVAAQSWLRWAIAAVLILTLSAVVLMRSQFMPVSRDLSRDVQAASDAINAIPNNATILVVVDYESSLVGEMEAMGAPVLNKIIHDHQTKLDLLATSPESAGLIERLLTTALITAQEGFNYVSGNQYTNLGYLPGGTTGIAEFVIQPNRVIPSAAAQFSAYSAVILLTDHAESGRAWIEQLNISQQVAPVILVTSAQTGPMLQLYVSSGQVAGMFNGIADAARYEELQNIPPKIARNYWDAFGVGIMLAILMIIIGSIGSLVSGFRARRASGEQG